MSSSEAHPSEAPSPEAPKPRILAEHTYDRRAAACDEILREALARKRERAAA